MQPNDQPPVSPTPEQPSTDFSGNSFNQQTPPTDPYGQAPVTPPVAPVVPPVAGPATPPQTAAYAPAPGADNPGKGLGIGSLVTSLLGFGLVGLILGIIATKKSKAAGQKNGLALAGIIIGIINMIGVAILVTFLIIGASALLAQCADLGPGTHYVDGVTYTCS